MTKQKIEEKEKIEWKKNNILLPNLLWGSPDGNKSHNVYTISDNNKWDVRFHPCLADICTKDDSFFNDIKRYPCRSVEFTYFKFIYFRPPQTNLSHRLGIYESCPDFVIEKIETLGYFFSNQTQEWYKIEEQHNSLTGNKSERAGLLRELIPKTITKLPQNDVRIKKANAAFKSALKDLEQDKFLHELVEIINSNGK